MNSRIAKFVKELDHLVSEINEEPPKSEEESMTRIVNAGRIRAIRDILKAIDATGQP